MQTLNLHDVESVTISPMQEYNNSQWITITIVHEGTTIEINLFPEKNQIPIEVQGIISGKFTGNL